MGVQFCLDPSPPQHLWGWGWNHGLVTVSPAIPCFSLWHKKSTHSLRVFLLFVFGLFVFKTWPISVVESHSKSSWIFIFYLICMHINDMLISHKHMGWTGLEMLACLQCFRRKHFDSTCRHEHVLLNAVCCWMYQVPSELNVFTICKFSHYMIIYFQFNCALWDCKLISYAIYVYFCQNLCIFQVQ